MDKRIVVLVALVGCVMIAFGLVELFSALSDQPIEITTSTVFAIPDYNCSIMFGQNGLCGKAFYENYSYIDWAFRDLYLGNRPFKSTYPTSRWLSISGIDCNLIIAGYDQTGETTGYGFLNYTVLGSGTQTFSFGGTIQNVTVAIDGTNRAQNDGWNLERSGSLLIVNRVGLKVDIEFTVLIPMPA
jgi:hypothetical protein